MTPAQHIEKLSEHIEADIDGLLLAGDAVHRTAYRMANGGQPEEVDGAVLEIRTALVQIIMSALAIANKTGQLETVARLTAGGAP